MLKKLEPLSGSQRPRFDFTAGGFKLCLGHETKIMGVLNVTPDSFSDGGNFMDAGSAEAQAVRMEEEGAHILDVGGESSRPGSKPVTAKEEIRRILPVLRRLSRKVKIPVSVDTAKFEVAQTALDEGACIINDIFALKNNKRLAKLIARYKAGVILMHMKGIPETMQRAPSYNDIFKEISAYLREAVDLALDAGIAGERIVVDPGFGFGKSADQNLTILSRLDLFAKLNRPLLAGLSRKSFIGNLLDAPVSGRLNGSLAAAAVAIQKGVHILRVHDVLPHRQLALLIDRTAAARTSKKETVHAA